MPPSLRTLALLSAAAAFLGGCAGHDGEFPSLAQRPAEREYAAEQVAEPKVRPPLPDDPAVAARVAAFVGEARSREGAFARAYSEAQAATARAGGPASDSWVLAQEAISRAVAAQAGVANVLAELDEYAAARAKGSTISPGDIAQLHEGLAEVQRIAEAQAARTQRLEASLSR